MASLTRAEAIAQARREFGAFVERALSSPGIPTQYASDLGIQWDRRLAALARVGSGTPVTQEVVNAMWLLAREVRFDDLDDDARFRWLDSFPDRVADLFPPSAVTFRLVDQEEREEAAQLAYMTDVMSSAA